MNKTVVGVLVAIAVVAAAYVGFSWWSGHAVLAQFDAWTAQMDGRSGHLLTLAARNRTQGLFASEDEWTLELNERMFDKAHAVKAKKHAAAMEGEADDTGDAAPEESADVEGSEARDADAAPRRKISKPWRFAIRHHIQHGPLPGFRSVGFANIDSRLVFDEPTRAQLTKLLGTADPVVMLTHLGLLGGGVTTLSSPAFDVTQDAGRASWKGAEGRFTFSRHFDSVKCNATVPGLQITATGALEFGLEQLAFDCDLERVFGAVYKGTSSFVLAHAGGKTSEEGSVFRVDDLRLASDVTVDGDFLDMAVKAGAATIVAPQATFDEVRYEITLKHLHGPTFGAIMQKVQELSESQELADAAANMAVAGAFVEYGPTLLENAPEVSIDHIGFKMPEGELGLTGTARIDGFTREDSRDDLMGKLAAQADVWVSEGVTKKLWGSGGAKTEGEGPTPEQRAQMIQQQLAVLEKAGYLRRNADRYESHLEFRGGALTANGKLLGAGPAGAPPGM